ncbi:hypothetical protein VC892_25705, partial [Citrobacter portucalensis]|nr:hypothetical protein [Citrobacter portucalensis]
KSAQIREILISESAWEEMTCLFAPSLNQRMHFLINIYGSKDDKKGEVVLRPLISNPDALILTPTEVIELNTQVIKADRMRHPEWFR